MKYPSGRAGESLNGLGACAQESIQDYTFNSCPAHFLNGFFLCLGGECAHRICDENGLNAQAPKAKACHFDAVFSRDSKYDGARGQYAHQRSAIGLLKISSDCFSTMIC